MKRWQFWFLSFTWGLPQTFIGCVVALLFIATGHKPKRWGYCIYFETRKEGQAGCEFGPFFVINKGADAVRNHELGHGIQNCIYGPFTLFLIFIPATVRYWIREYKARVLRRPLGAYDDFMLEGQATRLGAILVEQLKKEG